MDTYRSQLTSCTHPSTFGPFLSHFVFSVILFFFSSFNAIDRKIREVMHLTGNELLQEEEEKGQQQQQQYVKSL